ncbi:MAG: sigma 54-interacting transcriptional regulator [Deltaproteobacteria bacterium]|nr:sigma 54-interacting transcriptional regulator [Deltaproteobacteria bacterium]
MNERYISVRPLGRGGQSDVLLVRDLKRQGRLLALKRVPSTEADLSDLTLEFTRLARLRHPNLARAYDFGFDEEGAYFTSEFVDGPNVISWAKTAGEAEICRAMAAVLRALSMIHDRGLVHGDVSAGNILVAKGQDGSVPKLLDLGAARRPGQPGGGTAGFAAPEAISGRGLLPASDLYSFGAVLAHALFGRSAFGHGDASAVTMRQLNRQIDLPDASGSPVAGLCRDLLDPDPSRRCRSAAETLERLAAATGLDLAVGLGDLRGGDLPPPLVVGRDAEIAALAGLVDRLDDPDAERVVWIDGPPGSGRSVLLEELWRAGQVAGLRVIGRTGEPPRLGELVSGMVRESPGSSLAPAARAVLSPWTGEATAEPGRDAPSPSAVGFAATEALAATCATRPMIVVIDDFESADPLAQEVGRSLARALERGRFGRPRALLAFSGRPGEGGAGRDLPGATIRIGPLPPADTTRLVGSMLSCVSFPADLAEAVHLGSGGLPKVAQELVRGAAGPGHGETIAARARALVAAQGEPARTTLALLALAQDGVPAALLAEAAGLTSAEAEDIVRCGLLTELGEPGAERLKVAAVAGKVALDLVPSETLAAAAERLEVLLESRGHLAAAAALLARTGKVEAAGRVYVELARASAARGDLAGAAEWFTRALEPPSSEDGGRGPVAAQAARVFRALGRYDQALAALAAAGGDERESALLRAEILLESGRHREAHDLARGSWKERPSDTSFAAVAAAAALQLGQHETALSYAREALEVAGAAGEASPRLAHVGGLACVYLGRLEESASLFARAARGFEKAHDRLGQLKVAAGMGMLATRQGALNEARSAYDRAVALSRELGDRSREGLHLMNRGAVAHSAADFAAALDDYSAALDIATVLGNAFGRAQAEISLADLLSDLGDQPASLRLATMAMERCRALGQERLEVRGLLTAGVAALRAGDPVRAEGRLKEARRRFAAAGDDMGRVGAELRLAELAFVRGDLAGAAQRAVVIRREAEGKELTRVAASAAILGARALSEGADDHAAALALLDDAASLPGREGSPDDAWRFELARSQVLGRAGRRTESEAARAEAERGFAAVLAKVPGRFLEAFCRQEEAADLPCVASRGETSPDADRRARDLELLVEINRELTRELDPKRLLSLIMERAVELTGAERGMVVLPREGSLVPAVCHRLSDEIELGFSRSVAEQVVSEGRALLAVDALDDDRFRSFKSVSAHGLRSILCVPLSIRRKVVGAVYLDSRLRSGVFTDADRRLLEAFGSQAAIALETARLVSENSRRCEDLERANAEIRALTTKLERRLETNEAALRRVGALLTRAQAEQARDLLSRGIVGTSPAMARVLSLVDRIALADVPVHVFGESGTGKDLVARAIHARSERFEKPFVAVNCGALPQHLLASELFGHLRGSFTGAFQDRPGLFRLADGGTLFLDEVADMGPEMQAALLRVLQDGTFRPVGGGDEESADVRVVSAANRQLALEVKAGRFREDLFYRLHVVGIEVPPLRDRREDIPLLAEFFAARHAQGDPPSFSREALEVLSAAPWPGNVRELENEVQRAIAMRVPGSSIMPADLSPRLRECAGDGAGPEPGALKERVAAFELSAIRRVLSECGGNTTRAAKQLGMSRAGLYKKLGRRE